MTKVRVFSHCGGSEAIGLPPDLAEHIELVEVPESGPVPSGAPAQVLLSRRRAPGIYDAAACVEWVHILGTGVDTLDVPRLAAHATVTNSRGVAGVPIAEWVLGAMLAFEKQIPEIWVGSPEEWRQRPALGTLRGRTLGLVGLGSIGTETARRARAFGMDVRAARRSSGASEIDGVEVVALDDVLAASDHVVLACPLTPETTRMIDERALDRMKSGVHIVNPARGDLIDQDALRAALDSGQVARATLDTASPEPPPAGHWLYAHPRVRLSAHVSWSYPGAREASHAVFFENLRRYLGGKPLCNVIDPDVNY